MYGAFNLLLFQILALGLSSKYCLKKSREHQSYYLGEEERSRPPTSARLSTGFSTGIGPGIHISFISIPACKGWRFAAPNREGLWMDVGLVRAIYSQILAL